MYEMPTCPHCMKARSSIARYNGPVKFTIKNYIEAPPGVRGFPHFVGSNGKQVSGFSGSVESLNQELGLKENFISSVGNNNSKNMFIGVS
jgi:hypothetical protein